MHPSLTLLKSFDLDYSGGEPLQHLGELHLQRLEVHSDPPLYVAYLFPSARFHSSNTIGNCRDFCLQLLVIPLMLCVVFSSNLANLTHFLQPGNE